MKLITCRDGSANTCIRTSSFINTSNRWSTSTNSISSFSKKWNIFNSTILFIAVITIIIAGVRATTECDITKIIAPSTLRQLGILITSIGLNLIDLTYFHILTHALFKALLFVCAGTLIHFHLHSHDLRWIGNLTNQLPITTACIIISNLALCGFPFMAGFYSKDAILEISLFRRYRIILILLNLFLSRTYIILLNSIYISCGMRYKLQ